jgi:2-polyprenyl-3-methyl-5-hydroxy-6-metoxy-1,4-benzoquinol methylase
MLIRDYGSREYWDERYSSRDTARGLEEQEEEGHEGEALFDWVSLPFCFPFQNPYCPQLIAYEEMREWVREWVPREAFVVDLGCGNSLLAPAMREDGYTHVMGIDYRRRPSQLSSLSSLSCVCSCDVRVQSSRESLVVPAVSTGSSSCSRETRTSSSSVEMAAL